MEVCFYSNIQNNIAMLYTTTMTNNICIFEIRIIYPKYFYVVSKHGIILIEISRFHIFLVNYYLKNSKYQTNFNIEKI